MRTPNFLKASLVSAFAALTIAASAVEPTGEVPTVAGWKKTTVVKGLEHPWGMAFLPNGDILVTERPGRIRIVRSGQLVEQPVEGVPPVHAKGQGGLLDITVHPNFAQNKLIYFTFSRRNEDSNQTALARATFDGTKLVDVKELLRAEPAKTSDQHFGSVLEWLADGTLLMSVGDGGNPPVKVAGMLARDQAQVLDRHLGKVLRVKDDGTAPEDNPFVKKEGAKPEIWSYGHRNIQGIARDPKTNRVWTTEHGPRGGDELNLTESGKNYGWPKASFGRDYVTRELITPHESLPGMIDPKVVWVPSTAASGLVFYTGDKFPQWKGSLFSGGLVSQDLRRVKLDGANVLGQENIKIGRRVRDVVQGPDGFLYVLTDHANGEMIRIEPE